MGLITEFKHRFYKGADADKASIPSAAKSVGDEYFATDTKLLYKWNGAAWVWVVPDGAITVTQLADNAVETLKIKDANVTLAKLAPDALAWALVYDTVLAGEVASVTINGLLGNTAEMYLLMTRFISVVTGFRALNLRFNGDAGNNYNFTFHQYGGTHIHSTTAGTTFIRSSMIVSGNGPAFAKGLIYAKSGYRRGFLGEIGEISGPNGFAVSGNWTNTADQLTSITLLEEGGTNLGIGTHITLFKKARTSV